MTQKQVLDIGGEQKSKSKFSLWSNKLLLAGLMLKTSVARAGDFGNSTPAEKRIGIAIALGTFVVMGALATWQIIKENKKKKKIKNKERENKKETSF